MLQNKQAFEFLNGTSTVQNKNSPHKELVCPNVIKFSNCHISRYKMDLSFIEPIKIFLKMPWELPRNSPKVQNSENLYFSQNFIHSKRLLKMTIGMSRGSSRIQHIEM